jgi:hypothetical protein
VGCLATKKRDRFASFQSSGNVQRPNWEVWSVLTSLKLLATPKLTWHCPHQRCSLVPARLSILTLRAMHNFFGWANSHVGCWQQLVLRIWNQTNVKCLHYRLITFAIMPDEIEFLGLRRLFYAHKTIDSWGIRIGSTWSPLRFPEIPWASAREGSSMACCSLALQHRKIALISHWILQTNR